MTAMTDFERIEAEPLQSYRPVFITSLAAILCLFGAAIGWGMFARLDAAVVTQGVVLAESQRKSVEHLEGGILEQLWVRPATGYAKVRSSRPSMPRRQRRHWRSSRPISPRLLSRAGGWQRSSRVPES